MEEEILKEIRKNKIISIVELIIIIFLSIFQISYFYSQDDCDSYWAGDSLYEIDAFNNQFMSFEGIQNGINVKSLLARLMVSANTYEYEVNKIPNVFIDKIKDEINQNYLENQEIIFNNEEEEAYESYIRKLSNIRNNIENRHDYYVEFTFQDSGHLDYIIISYNPENSAEVKYRKDITN